MCTFAETDGDTRIGAWFITVASYLFKPGLLLLVFVKRNILGPLAEVWLGGFSGYIITGARRDWD